jgi:hypothetical protein
VNSVGADASVLQSASRHADGDGVLAQTTTTTNLLGGAVLFILIVEVVFLIAFVIAWVKILSKAGYSGAWALVGVIPIVNIVMFFVFAFSRWPVLDRPSGFYNAPPPFNPGGYQPPGYQPPGYQPPSGYGAAASWQAPGAVPPPPPAPPRGRATPLNSTLREAPAWYFGTPRPSTSNDVPPPPPPPL